MNGPDLIDAYVTDVVADLHAFMTYWSAGSRKNRDMFPLLLTREEWDIEFTKWVLDRTNKLTRPPAP